MKKIIYISGLVSVNLMLYGALLKVLHLPGANILLTVSILLFSLGFLPLALQNNYKNQDESRNKWLYIVTFIVFAICLVSALFKILHWPYASLLMFIGVPLPFVLFLPIYLYQTRKNKSQPLINHLGVMFGLTFLAVFSVFLALNLSTGFLNNYAQTNFNNESTTKFYETAIKTNTSHDVIKERAAKLSAFIEELKSEITISVSNGQNVNEKQKDSNNPFTGISNKSATVLSIFNAENDKSKIAVLKEMLDEYNTLISTSTKSSKELKALSNQLFYANSNGMESSKWIEREFPSNQLIIVIDVLNRIQSNVRFVEAEYLSSL